MSNRIIVAAGLLLVVVCGLFAYVLIKRVADGDAGDMTGDVVIGSAAAAAQAPSGQRAVAGPAKKTPGKEKAPAVRDPSSPKSKPGSPAAAKPLLEGWEPPAAAFVI